VCVYMCVFFGELFVCVCFWRVVWVCVYVFLRGGKNRRLCVCVHMYVFFLRGLCVSVCVCVCMYMFF